MENYTVSKNGRWASYLADKIEIRGDFVIKDDGCLIDYTGSGGDVTLPEEIKQIGRFAFQKMEAITSVTLPEGLEQIGGYAFYQCKSLKEVTIPASVTEVCDGAFYSCPKLERVTLLGDQVKYLDIECRKRVTLVAPKLVPNDLKDADERLALVLGWIANPELFPEESREAYEKYAKNQKAAILEAAETRSAAVKKAVKLYYGLPLRAAPKKSENPYEKLSAKQKVLLLEETVLSGDMEKLEEVLAGCGEFEFTARALGLACRFGSFPMVRRLVKAGANFTVYWNSSVNAKYDTYTTYNGWLGSDTVFHNFEYMLIADTVDDLRTFGGFRGIAGQILVSQDVEAVDFETFVPEQPCNGAFGVRAERRPIPEEERVAILCWLYKKTNRNKVKMEADVFYQALVWGKDAFVDALLDEGVELCNFDVSRLDAGQRRRIVPRMLDIAKRQGGNMPVTLELLCSMVGDTELVRRLLDEGKLPEKMDTTKLLKKSMEPAGAGTLSLCLERGYLKSAATREKLIAQAIEEKKTEHTAVLLEYKNRTADLAREAALQEKRMEKDLTADPNSAYMVKKLWRYEKQKDGTILLTSYKGPGGAVYVPDRVGKAAVTAIGESAFSAWAYSVGAGSARLTAEQRNARKEITSVEIPEGVKSIGASAFEDCEKLESVTLPQSLKKLGARVFQGCAALKSIVIPEGVKKLESNVFECCSDLESVTLPKGLLSIGEMAFKDCGRLSAVELPSSVRKIEEDAFYNCGELKKIVIPKGVQKLESNVFRDCAALESVTLPEGLMSIGYMAFAGCLRLSAIEIPSSVEKLEQAVFEGCGKLKKIVIPAGVKELEMYIFEGCEELVDLTIPASVTEIYPNLFGRLGTPAPGLTIHGAPGSAAEEFAKSIQRTFEPL